MRESIKYAHPFIKSVSALSLAFAGFALLVIKAYFCRVGQFPSLTAHSFISGAFSIKSYLFRVGLLPLLGTGFMCIFVKLVFPLPLRDLPFRVSKSPLMAICYPLFSLAWIASLIVGASGTASPTRATFKMNHIDNCNTLLRGVWGFPISGGR